MQIRRVLLLAPLALAMGCMKTTIKTGAPPGAVSEEKAVFWLYGLIGEENFNLDATCPNGVSRIEEFHDFGNVVGMCLTCSIYTPRTVKITCASGSSYLLTPDEENGRTLVTPALAANLTPSE